MVSTANYRPWLIGGWLTTLAVIVTVSVAMDANRSTTWLLLALGMAPALVMAILRGSAASPTVAEILYSAGTKNGRP